ncbi:putative Lactate 2-monooxygenase [Glarea lozoyensis 74030]|uniref:Putative Lactate 2-monooxygenase n=1 Tax=Glarea lozoyensis (strain ATCC 74030 / MF5533) TaxID=1104152 RepID=H0EY32_GLAL7|nr:putative Lactate 2-monooxygenase [Glarea lozoyensis 74030]
MFDSGVRGAADVFKALALGAKFVFVGRLWVWGLSIKGELGVRHVMKALLADFDILMNVAGYQNVEQIERDSVESLPSSAGLIAEKTELIMLGNRQIFAQNGNRLVQYPDGNPWRTS